MAGTLLFNALREAIDEEMGRDPHVCVMGEDVGHYGGSYKVTKDLAEKYGDLRVLDTPIAENGFTGELIYAVNTVEIGLVDRVLNRQNTIRAGKKGLVHFAKRSDRIPFALALELADYTGASAQIMTERFERLVEQFV